MVYALRALRRRQNLLLDTCEIFVKEPLLDWAKAAKQQQRGRQRHDDSVELDWYPKRKIEVLKDKLDGRNSAYVMLKELQQSRLFKKV